MRSSLVVCARQHSLTRLYVFQLVTTVSGCQPGDTMWVCGPRYQRGIRNLLPLGVYCLPEICGKLPLFAFFALIICYACHVDNLFLMLSTIFQFYAILSQFFKCC